VGARRKLANFKPAILDPNTLWNVEQLYFLPANSLSPGSAVKAGPPPREFAWSEERLVRECCEGNQAAWSALIEKYKNLIFSIPIKFGLSREDAADVFQAVCADLWQDCHGCVNRRLFRNGLCRPPFINACAGKRTGSFSWKMSRRWIARWIPAANITGRNALSTPERTERSRRHRFSSPALWPNRADAVL